MGSKSATCNHLVRWIVYEGSRLGIWQIFSLLRLYMNANASYLSLRFHLYSALKFSMVTLFVRIYYLNFVICFLHVNAYTVCISILFSMFLQTVYLFNVYLIIIANCLLKSPCSCSNDDKQTGTSLLGERWFVKWESLWCTLLLAKGFLHYFHNY